MKKVLIGLFIAVVLIVILGVVGVTFFLDGAIKKGVETIGPQIAKVDIKLAGVNVSILSGAGSVKGLVIGNPEGYKTDNAISVGTASLGLSPGSLLSDKIVVKHVRVEAPEITFEGGLGGNNLSKILDNVTAAAGGETKGEMAPKEDTAGKKLQVDDFLITGAKLKVSLTGMAGQTVTVPLPDIHLTGLGQGSDGITGAELTRQVLGKVVEAATKAAASDAVKDLTKGATDALKGGGQTMEKATKGITDLFKKDK